VARLLALFKIRNILTEAGAVHRLALVCILDPVNSGRFHIASRHIRVGKRVNRRDMPIVSIELDARTPRKDLQDKVTLP